MGQSLTFTLASAAATEAHGAGWGRAWRAAGQRRLLVGLVGDLGAGKTTWVRGLLRGLGVTGPVRSPTYTLVEPYEQDGLWIVHADLYRLGEAAELTPLGLDEWLDREPCWIFVEWPERAEPLMRLLDITVELLLVPAGRQLSAVAHSPAGASALARANLEQVSG
jgi:tRNA threonylcarbamoyladenosine biosynthesis protein TsaE